MLGRGISAQENSPTEEASAISGGDLAFEQLIDRARQRAAEPYTDPNQPLPENLLALDYDGHRDIRCLPENFLWYGGKEPFRVQFRHRGWLFKDEVALATVDADGKQVRPLPFSPDRFTYGPIAREKLDPRNLPDDLGYAGLALHRVGYETIDGVESETFNEFMSIQGGSYFRAIGHGQHWGSSVRGIAINTGLPQPEEFPQWAELWVKQPTPGDNHLILYGLMDGPSVTGAYKLIATPGSATPESPAPASPAPASASSEGGDLESETLTVEVESRLFFRNRVEKLGLAPITGMFLFGEESPARYGDYRPEVHDADGLLMQHANGELDWRALRNPPALAVSRFKMTDPKGFGLIQRDRAFAHYEDLETEMHIRPSVWVTPTPGSDGKGWGEGWVELLEIASDDEGIDNMGAYWVPADESIAVAGGEHSLSYRIDFTRQPRPIGSALIKFTATRSMLGSGGEEENSKSLVRTAADDQGRAVGRFILDTAPGSALPNGTIVRSDVTTTRGQIIGEPVIQYNKFTHAYRLFFDVRADGVEPVEMRVTLRGATAMDKQNAHLTEAERDAILTPDPDTGPPLSETWLYRWDPMP